MFCLNDSVALVGYRRRVRRGGRRPGARGGCDLRRLLPHDLGQPRLGVDVKVILTPPGVFCMENH